MKKFYLFLLTISLLLPTAIKADSNINLTPVPMKMTVSEGKLTIPEYFTISTGTLPDSLKNEAVKFAKLFSNVSGYSITLVSDGTTTRNTTATDSEEKRPFIKMSLYKGNEDLGCEGYTLNITNDGIDIAATCANGFYYAFQSIKKMLPACVMAGVADENITEYSLPIVNIIDAPRFEYRGFMLDVSRHYFSVEEIKRMIEVMSYYKMNRFHWHLTDDQGWRFEVKKYPRLTTVGAVRNNSWSVDPIYGGYYTNEPYGPYFYTQEECREIVAYAAERHIEVVPEVEFPGHSCAVNAAYPEFSCSPNGSHSVQVNGGIFSDVLNVANPNAVQFVKDVIDEVIEVFPYSQIHIGGDETPTSAWQNNAECQALMKEKGFSNIRELQSYFVRQISDHVTQKEGDKKRTVIMWNESLTANGTNEDLIKGTGGMMMCWESGQVQPCALKAAKFGMKSVITPWGPYYINRKQSSAPGEPTGAGSGDDTVEKTYNYVPVPADVPTELQKYYVGVQGTFWTEHVQSNYLLEYLALPRLIAIAETGWTPAAKKNFNNFQQRITKDTLLLNYNNYEYGRHYILTDNANKDTKVMPKASTDEEQVWYRIVTTTTDARAGRCIQLLRENSSEIGTGNAKANRLWNSEIIEDENNEGYNYQLWAFMQDPQNPERWAIVNKAKPAGSVKGTPTAENNTGRWDYDDTTRHYDFIFGDRAYAANGSNYNYSIRSQKVSNTSMCLNFAGPGQDYSINLWSNPADGNGGIWEFRPLVAEIEEIIIEYPTVGTLYRITNNTERFKGWTLYDNNDGVVTAAKQVYGADVWEITEEEITDNGQNIKLRNVATGRYIDGTTTPITIGESGITLTNVYNTRSEDFSIKAGNAALCPVPERATTNPNTLTSGEVYPQGTGWIYEKAHLVTYICTDENGETIKKSYRSAAAGNTFTATAPEITNYEIVKYEESDNADAPVFENIDENKVVNVIYKRTAYSIIYRCFTADGNHITDFTVPCRIGETHKKNLPEIEFFTCLGSNDNDEEITPYEDTVIEVYYDTDGIIGAAAIGNAVTELEAGASYLIYNAHKETARSGFLSVNAIDAGITTTNDINEANPGFVWNFDGDGNRFTVKNNYDIYVPKLKRGELVTGGSVAETFIFTLNTDDKTWKVKGTSNNYYWNGNANNTFTGWDDGHPFIIYTYKPQPYFSVRYTCVDEEGKELANNVRYIKGGDYYTLIEPIIEGYIIKENNAAKEELSYVSKNIEFTITYSEETPSGIKEIITNDNATIYDLSGRIITTPAKGLYIKGGKKIIIK